MSTGSNDLSFEDENRSLRAAETSDLAEALALLVALGWRRALFTINEAKQILNTSRAGIYRDIAARRLDAVKNGSATRIPAQSLARRLAGLPRARVR
jgi:Helix-turn-helix domain